MNILVLGATGMLGHKMFQVLRNRFPDTSGIIRGSISNASLRRIDLFHQGNVIENVNVEDLVFLHQMLLDLKPRVIVNCIGVIKQRPQARQAIPSILLNALLPHKLSEICGQWRGRLIHFSTDCVFSGIRGGYVEDDPSDAEDLYGKTKHLGEVVTENTLTLRTSMIGRELTRDGSLLEWFLGQNHTKVVGFTRALYSGVTTNYLAEVVGNIIADYPRLSGLYQVTSQTISKYELLCRLREAYCLDIEIVPDATFACNRSMNGHKFCQATGYQCPPWSELIGQLASDPTSYENWKQEK